MRLKKLMMLDFEPAVSLPFCSEFQRVVLNFVAGSYFEKATVLARAVNLAADDGKATALWADSFGIVFGVDQYDQKPYPVREGRLPKNVCFKIGPPDCLDFKEESLDFIYIGQEFLNVQRRDAFFDDVRRTLRHNGVFCCFSPKYIEAELDRVEATVPFREVVIPRNHIFIVSSCSNFHSTFVSASNV